MLEEILRATREAIKDYAGDDADKWFYANRYVFARLQLDERKIKSRIKGELIETDAPCAYCQRRFESKTGIHLHRIDSKRGYSLENAVLMHAECHNRHHAESRNREFVTEPNETTSDQTQGTLTKYSKRYDNSAFLYWWDITPNLAANLTTYDFVQFVKKDVDEYCSVSPGVLTGFLVGDRQTSRGDGNWGIKVLKEHPNELAFEPPRRGEEWLFLPVMWLSDRED